MPTGNDVRQDQGNAALAAPETSQPDGSAAPVKPSGNIPDWLRDYLPSAGAETSVNLAPQPALAPEEEPSSASSTGDTAPLPETTAVEPRQPASVTEVAFDLEPIDVDDLSRLVAALRAYDRTRNST